MDLKTEPYLVTRREIQWLASALYPDSYREVLTFAGFVEHENEIYLATTNAIVLHLLHLGPGSTGGRALRFDVRRALLELRYCRGAVSVGIERDLSGVALLDKKANEIAGVETAIIRPHVGTFPNVMAVVPKELEPAKTYTLNASYLTRAVALATDVAGIAIFQGPTTRPCYKCGGTGLDPNSDLTRQVVCPTCDGKREKSCIAALKIVPNSVERRWTAVIMPTAFSMGDEQP